MCMVYQLFQQFDRELMKGWDSAMDNGHFRYKIDQMKTRIVPGQYKYVLQVGKT